MAMTGPYQFQRRILDEIAISRRSIECLSHPILTRPEDLEKIMERSLRPLTAIEVSLMAMSVSLIAALMSL